MLTSASVFDELGNLEFDLDVENDGSSADNDLHLGSLTVERSIGTPVSISNIDEPIEQNIELEEIPVPVFYETIPTLYDMTFFALAIALWRRVISLKKDTGCGSNCHFICQDDEQEVEKLLRALPIPGSVRSLAMKYLEQVKNEMNNWLRFYKKNLFASRRASGEGTVDIGDLLFCVWLPNGKIDDRKSAMNMLSNPRLTQVDRFRIMCRYCLEDEIRKVSADSLPSYFTKRILFSKNSLVYYWLCRVNCDLLDKLPKNAGDPIEFVLITAFNVDTWSAIEYFWDRLNVNEQISVADKLLKLRPEFQKELFSKMNDFQKRHLLFNIPVEIATNFWLRGAQERYAYLTWMYVRNLVTYDQFSTLIRELLSESLPSHNDKIACLVDIWKETPNHLKKQSLQKSMIDMIVKLHVCYRTDLCSNIDFLLAYLTYCSVEFRKKFVFERVEDLVLKVDPSTMDQLLKLCLPDSQDVVEFKKYVRELHYIQNGFCDILHDDTAHRLNIFLEYYCPDLSTRSEFCSEFLEHFSVRGCPFYCLCKWLHTVAFIDDNLLDTFPQQAFKFKKRLVWFFSDYCCELWTKDKRSEMDKMIEVINEVLTPEELSVFKMKALERLPTRYRWIEFDRKVVEEFMSWCCDGDEQRVKHFKRSISIDYLFKTVFDSMTWNSILVKEIDQEKAAEVFHPIDKMLVWFFKRSEVVKRFKLDKLFGRCDDPEESVIRQYSLLKNEIFIKNTLPWFFEGEQEEIEKFKQLYRDDVIGDMI